MLQKERQNKIIELLKRKKTVKITELAEHFRTSIITIRRDFQVLEKAGIIKKIYGGAMLIDATPSKSVNAVFSARMEANALAKKQIAAAAAALVQSGDTIVLDIGTTCFAVAKQLKPHTDVTVLTNSLPVLNELLGSDLTVYSLGGMLRSGELALCGSMAIHALDDFCVSKAFIGAGGVTLENGLTTHNQDTARLCAALTRRADETILLADSSKFGKNTFAVIGPLECVDTIITDSGINPEYAEAIRERGIRLIIAE